MASDEFFDQHRAKIAIALVLTFASGLVDIAGYLGIFDFFTAHLTGTTVQFGRYLVARQWNDVLAAASIVAAYMGGSIVGRALIEIGSRRRFRRIASITLTTEAALLALVAFRNAEALRIEPYGGLALLAAAMGLQTATLTGIGPLTVHTTFVTGMLNKIGQLVSHLMFRGYDLLRGKSAGENARHEQEREVEMTVFLCLIWLVYVGGAVAGTWAFALWGLRALFIAVVLLAVALIADQLSPLSIREEREQSEA